MNVLVYLIILKRILLLQVTEVEVRHMLYTQLLHVRVLRWVVYMQLHVSHCLPLAPGMQRSYVCMQNPPGVCLTVIYQMGILSVWLSPGIQFAICSSAADSKFKYLILTDIDN